MSSIYLGAAVKPKHYNIWIREDLKTLSYEGNVTIDVDILEKTDSITLNSTGIAIEKAQVLGKEVKVVHGEQIITLKTGPLSENSQAAIFIEFKGKLNDHLQGFYKASYADEDEDEEQDEADGNAEEGHEAKDKVSNDSKASQFIATTHFEPILCRSVIPCFDQPDLKATFDVNISVQEKYTALSNMDIKSVTLQEDGYKLVKFNRSPLMPTYLLAFTIGELESIQSKTSRIPLRVWTVPEQSARANFALGLAETALKFYEEQFKIDYPLPKLDLVAIPDFEKSAMENFGLISFRDQDLLADMEHAATYKKNAIAETVFHEISHQWFGNLVSISSWSDLWLKEGFATWMSWYAINKFYPEWKPWESYIMYGLHNSLTVDARRTSHPVQVPIQSLHDIEQGFDEITYDKGCSLLTMIAKWIGEDTFILGVSNYLRKHSWKCASSEDLWESLGEVSGKDIKSVMDIWVNKVGFPVVTVDEDPKTKVITVSQRRYLSAGDCKPEEDETLFPIFLNVKTSKGIDKSLVVTDRRTELSLNLEDDFFKINADQIGFYRTAYTEARWQKLGEAGRDGKLSVEDRLGLLADCAKLASTGYVSTVSFLNLVREWSLETNGFVWNEIILDLYDIQDTIIFADESFNLAFENFIRKLIEKQVKNCLHISDTDSHETKQLKTLILGTGYSVADPIAVQYCQEQFSKFLNEGASLNPDQRPIIFKCAAKYGGEQEYEQLLELYKTSSVEEITDDILVSLGRFSQPSILQKVTKLALELNEGDVDFTLVNMSFSKTGIAHLWNWLRNEWETIVEKVGYGSGFHIAIIKTCTLRLGTQEQKDEIEAFFKDKTGVLDRTIAYCLEKVSENMRWPSSDLKHAHQWLKENNFEV